jgi:hypothetical protein
MIKGESLMNKIIYVDMYFRCTGVKNGRDEFLRANASGIIFGSLTEEYYTEIKKGIVEKYKADGYQILEVECCSKKEYTECGSDEEILDAPLGYIEIYLSTVYEMDGKEQYDFVAWKSDFNTFFDESLWDGFASAIKREHEKTGCTNIRIHPVTKEIYEKYKGTEEFAITWEE